jgi:hypothetical protein
MFLLYFLRHSILTSISLSFFLLNMLALLLSEAYSVFLFSSLFSDFVGHTISTLSKQSICPLAYHTVFIVLL